MLLDQHVLPALRLRALDGEDHGVSPRRCAMTIVPRGIVGGFLPSPPALRVRGAGGRGVRLAGTGGCFSSPRAPSPPPPQARGGGGGLTAPPPPARPPP